MTSLQKADELVTQIDYCNPDIVQLVDSQKIETYNKLKKELPNVELMQVIHVIDKNSVKEAVEISKYVDFILLDSGNPNLKIKVLGGTGTTHNWDLSREIVEQADVPVFLAGGLQPDNVAEAIEKIQPFGVDLCTGIRTNGYLNKDKTKLFFEAVNK